MGQETTDSLHETSLASPPTHPHTRTLSPKLAHLDRLEKRTMAQAQEAIEAAIKSVAASDQTLNQPQDKPT